MAQPFLIYRNADDAQVLVDLTQFGGPVTIGRRPANDVVLDWDDEISRVHAALERLGEVWTVVDDGLSLNGSFVNGDRVTSRRRLRDGDVLSIGRVTIAFRATSGSSISPPTETAVGPNAAERMTPSQRRVLTALCRPYNESTYAAPASNQQIADELVLSVETVKGTLRSLFELFRVDALPQNQKRASLVREALRAGAITRREQSRAA